MFGEVEIADGKILKPQDAKCVAQDLIGASKNMYRGTLLEFTTIHFANVYWES